MNEDVFSTKDIGLAASLCSFQHSVLRLDLQFEGKKVSPVGYFKFERTPDLEKLVTSYNMGNLLVKPQDYHAALRNLKSLVAGAS